MYLCVSMSSPLRFSLVCFSVATPPGAVAFLALLSEALCLVAEAGPAVLSAFSSEPSRDKWKGLLH